MESKGQSSPMVVRALEAMNSKLEKWLQWILGTIRDLCPEEPNARNS